MYLTSKTGIFNLTFRDILETRLCFYLIIQPLMRLWKIAVLTEPNMILFIYLPGSRMWPILRGSLLNCVLLEWIWRQNLKKLMKQFCGQSLTKEFNQRRWKLNNIALQVKERPFGWYPFRWDNDIFFITIWIDKTMF